MQKKLCLKKAVKRTLVNLSNLDLRFTLCSGGSIAVKIVWREEVCFLWTHRWFLRSYFFSMRILKDMEKVMNPKMYTVVH